MLIPIVKSTYSWTMLVFIAACGSASEGAEPAHLGVDGGASVATEQDTAGCPSDPHTLNGSAGAGTTCGNATDCAPVCCPCASGKGGWSAAACVDGVCADAKNACAQSTDDARYCQ